MPADHLGRLAAVSGNVSCEAHRSSAGDNEG